MAINRVKQPPRDGGQPMPAPAPGATTNPVSASPATPMPATPMPATPPQPGQLGPVNPSFDPRPLMRQQRRQGGYPPNNYRQPYGYPGYPQRGSFNNGGMLAGGVGSIPQQSALLTGNYGQTGGNMLPGQGPIDFTAGFDPSKSIWGEQGRKAYAGDKAREFFKTQASGSALFDQWNQINQQNPLAARAFRQAVQGSGGGQNDFEQQLLQRGFGGDIAKYNEYRNAAHYAGQEGLEGGFDLTTGRWDTQRPDQPAYQVQNWNPASFRQGQPGGDMAPLAGIGTRPAPGGPPRRVQRDGFDYRGLLSGYYPR